MAKLNILLVGVNPELSKFLCEADSNTGYIGEIHQDRDSAEPLAEQIRKKRINMVILNPLANDSHKLDENAIALISQRKALPHKVVFVLHTDPDKAASLLKGHPGIEVGHFLKIDQALQDDPSYYDHLRSGLEKGLTYLFPDRRKTSFRRRISLASLLIVLYLVAIYFSLNWGGLQSHSNKLGLYLCSAIIVMSVCLAILKREWQASALTAGALGALLVIAQIIGGDRDGNASPKSAEPPASTGRPASPSAR